MIPLPLGLLSWMTLGALIGVAGSIFLALPQLASSQRPSHLSTTVISMLGAILGGLLATLLRFGGLVSYDTRSLAIAGLSAMVALVWWRIARLARSS